MDPAAAGDCPPGCWVEPRSHLPHQGRRSSRLRLAARRLGGLLPLCGPDANPEQVALDKIGVSGEGRRNGMDKGWQTEPLVELRQAKRRQARESQMSAALARSKESQIGESMEVKIASARVR